MDVLLRPQESWCGFQGSARTLRESWERKHQKTLSGVKTSGPGTGSTLRRNWSGNVQQPSLGVTMFHHVLRASNSSAV